MSSCSLKPDLTQPGEHERLTAVIGILEPGGIALDEQSQVHRGSVLPHTALRWNKKEGTLLMAIIDKPFGKYAHPEVERKFLLATIPPGSTFRADILDHSIPKTTLRLRRMQTEHDVTFKLAQKLRVHPHETRVIFHTNFYLSESEYVFLATTLPSHRLEKRRFRFHSGTIPMGIDQFQGPLEGLLIAEVDFGPNGDPASLPIPSFAFAEVTDDERITGARLAMATPSQVQALLDEFNVK